MSSTKFLSTCQTGYNNNTFLIQYISSHTEQWYHTGHYALVSDAANYRLLKKDIKVKRINFQIRLPLTSGNNLLQKDFLSTDEGYLEAGSDFAHGFLKVIDHQRQIDVVALPALLH